MLDAAAAEMTIPVHAACLPAVLLCLPVINLPQPPQQQQHRQVYVDSSQHPLGTGHGTAHTCLTLRDIHKTALS